MFWDNFVSLCAKVNKSPNAVIEEIGCASSAAVTGWKKGAQPREKVLIMIADYFGISVPELTSNKSTAMSERIAERKKIKGVSNVFLEKQTGAYRGKFSDLAAGKTTLTRDELVVVAATLDTTVDYLTGLTNDPAPAQGAGDDYISVPKEKRKVVELVMELTVEETEAIVNLCEVIIKARTAPQARS